MYFQCFLFYNTLGDRTEIRKFHEKKSKAAAHRKRDGTSARTGRTTILYTTQINDPHRTSQRHDGVDRLPEVR